MDESLSPIYASTLRSLLKPHQLFGAEGRLREDLTKQALSNLKTDFEFFMYKTAWALTFFKNGVSQGVAFTDLTGPVYGALSITGSGSKVKIEPKA